MKTLYFIIVFICFFNVSFSQELIKNEIDEFTGKKIKRTEWVSLTSGMQNKELKQSLVKVDSSYAINIKFTETYTPHSINKGNEMMLKLENGEVVTLYCENSKVSCIGCGATGFVGSKAPGLDVFFPFTKEQLDKLLISSLAKIRLYLNEGYSEFVIKEKSAKKFLEALKAIN